jgi:O-antigen/teichoic acid export membrane protein
MKRSVGHNALINFSGYTLQLAVALIATPLYIHRIGPDRYGILAIVWLLLGYFGLFDMGLGSATTTLVAKLRGPERRSSLFWTALTLNAGFGAAGAALLVCAGPLLFAHLKMPPELRSEVAGSIGWLAFSVIVAVLSSVVAGAVGGRERFFALSACQLTGTLAFTLAPLAVAYAVGTDLRWLIPAAVLARVCGTIPLAFCAWRYVPIGAPRFERRWVRALLGFGGWVTVTNAVSPLLVFVDRLVIGAISGSAAVAYYTVPANLALRVSVVSQSLAGALFPRFSALRGDQARALAARALLGLATLMTPAVVFGIFAMKAFVWHWLGPALADVSAPVGEIVLVGVWANSLAAIPYVLLAGTGKPRVIATFHLLELAPLIAVLMLFVHLWGVNGAAWAWTLRVTVDAGLLCAACRFSWRTYAPLIAPALMVLASAALVPFVDAHPALHPLAAAVALGAASLWAYLSAPRELKSRVLGVVRRRALRAAA